MRSLLEFFDELDDVVNNLKSDVEFAIRNKKIEEGDFYGYFDVTEKIKLKALNVRNVVKALQHWSHSSNQKSCGVSLQNLDTKLHPE
ncbi:hypothetical protein PIB30_071659 [Stylosanthes scabra]|uniref:Uncharacterized protein n=1 Tax=Stylosanthes scabra TaxID=79078 RepID=A0ABU6RPF6_9FABA|nr:hypothetical protein [Stylosanthes scabra]